MGDKPPGKNLRDPQPDPLDEKHQRAQGRGTYVPRPLCVYAAQLLTCLFARMTGPMVFAAGPRILTVAWVQVRRVKPASFLKKL